jgi:hypothetical protein
MNNEVVYKLHVRQGDLEIEVQGDKAFVEARFDDLRKQLAGETRSQTTAQSVVDSTPSPNREVAVSEFVKNLKADQQTDVVLGMAFYLLRERKQDSFTSGDIYRLYAESRLPKTNVNLAIIGNIRKGFVMERSERKNGLKLFSVTPSGEEYIDKTLANKPG